MVTANESSEALAELVAGYVKDIAVGDVRFTVAAPERIYLSHGYWRVPVHPSYWPGDFFRWRKRSRFWRIGFVRWKG